MCSCSTWIFLARISFFLHVTSCMEYYSQASFAWWTALLSVQCLSYLYQYIFFEDNSSCRALAFTALLFTFEVICDKFVFISTFYRQGYHKVVCNFSYKKRAVVEKILGCYCEMLLLFIDLWTLKQWYVICFLSCTQTAIVPISEDCPNTEHSWTPCSCTNC